MSRLLGVLLSLILLVAGGLWALYHFGRWSPNFWMAKAYPVQGIDVSNHQGKIDWKKVAESKVAFAYIKATEGGDFRDHRFNENWKEAAKCGVARGAYHYFSMKSTGREQAENFIATVPVDAGALPPAVDLELFGNSQEPHSATEFRKELADFLKLLRTTYGKEPVIYTDNDFSSTWLVGYSIKRLWAPNFFTMPHPRAGTEWVFWQFTERGRVPGVAGYVDRDVYSGDPEALSSLAGSHR